jgi:hypothetical protein
MCIYAHQTGILAAFTVRLYNWGRLSFWSKNPHIVHRVCMSDQGARLPICQCLVSWLSITVAYNSQILLIAYSARKNASIIYLCLTDSWLPLSYQTVQVQVADNNNNVDKYHQYSCLHAHTCTCICTHIANIQLANWREIKERESTT